MKEPQKIGGQYKFTINENHENYSSGRVLYGVAGATNFPVRLSSEIFQRCAYYLASQGNKGPYVIYDPFCGAAYSLTVIGFLHGENIKSIYASDLDLSMLEIAKKNLSLLTEKGLANRVDELKKLKSLYKKGSHKEALDSASVLAKKLVSKGISSKAVAYNMLSGSKIPFDTSAVDLIITDVPYGKMTNWEKQKKDSNPVQQFLDNIKPTVKSGVLIAISMDKKQEATYEGYTKVKSFKLGTRKVLFLIPN